jgi:hypothetical protein
VFIANKIVSENGGRDILEDMTKYNQDNKLSFVFVRGAKLVAISHWRSGVG